MYTIHPVTYGAAIPARFPNVSINTVGGKAFADFMVTPETQKVIGEFGKDKYGETLFVPDAGKSEAEVGL